MMKAHKAHDDQVFILRFWREVPGDGEEPRWRAQVRNINTSARQVADDVEGAFAVVRTRLKTIDLDSTDPPSEASFD